MNNVDFLNQELRRMKRRIRKENNIEVKKILKAAYVKMSIIAMKPPINYWKI